MSSAEFARFRTRVLTDVALREAFWAEPNLDAFVALALRLGGAQGFTFSANDVHAALAGERGSEDLLPPERAELLDGFVPTAVQWRRGAGVVEWCRFDTRRFVEPFFDQTIRAAQRHPFNRAFTPRTSLDDLVARSARRPGVPPAGFVFHVSRCGSTLVAQTFAALARLLVLSEPTPLDTIVRAHEQLPELDRPLQVAWLRAMLAALTQRRGAEQQAIVKLDAWHASYLPLIEAAFPGVPWVFLVREPLEVLVSHRRQVSWMMAALNAPSLLGCTPQEAVLMQPDEYRAQVLGRILSAMVEHGAADRTIDYRALPDAIWDELAPRFGLALSAAERALLYETAKRDAKTPVRSFVADAEEKRGATDAVLEDCVERWMARPYASLMPVRPAPGPCSS
ncbi:MAG TPA: Nif11-like leader peptide family natural product precursor [Candidatus Sulfotelmatobacter sp.]|nr:Nif11-like leader peptide family natural product precursor [Candidatus Sulfotelmatobacter sp.]